MNSIDYYGTLGPSCESIDVLKRLINLGMTGIRINLSHISLKQCVPWLENLKKAQESSGKKIKLMIDMQGPELRIGKLKNPVQLKKGQEIFAGEGGLPFPKEVLEHMKIDQQVLLDDGTIKLKAVRNKGGLWQFLIIDGGVLHSRKSIALPGVNIKLPALSQNDYENIAMARECGVTGVMQPFVRSGEDLKVLRDALNLYKAGNVDIFAKLEDMDGVNNLDEIAPLCQQIVIARGDLGNSIPLWRLPSVQKTISKYCRHHRKPFMVVTQLLNSMIERPTPTRAEVLDIYNAVIDGAASLMLTGETAVGNYPEKAMEYMVRTGNEAIREFNHK